MIRAILDRILYYNIIVGMWLYNTRDKIHINLIILVQLLLGSEILCLLHGLVEHLSSFAASLLQGFVDGRGVLLEERQDNPRRGIIRQSEKGCDADNYLE